MTNKNGFNNSSSAKWFPELTTISLLVLLTLGTFLATASVFAAAVKMPTKAVVKPDADQANPLGCRDVGYQFDLKVLELLPEAAGERQSLYFVLNKLNQPINLFQMLQDESTRSMYLNHQIRPQQWGVLSTSEKYLKYICAVDDGKTPYGNIVDCAESIKVCEYANVKYGLNNRGNFWLVNSNNRNGAVWDVIHYGIIPR